MSYILDALRRADAERQRGAVPGLHDQTPALASASAGALATPHPPARSGWLWVGAVLALGLMLGAAWWLGRGAGEGVAPAATAAPVAPVVATAAPTAAPNTTPAALTTPIDAPTTGPMTGPMTAPMAGPVTTPTTTSTSAPAPSPLPTATPPPPSPARASSRIVAPGPPPLPSRPPVVTLQPAGRATAVVAEAASDPVRSWASLPAASKAALPPLTWSGVVYAERADQRLVVVNGQVAREGDALASGLQLLKIGPKSVLLRWQGQRIEMSL